MKRILSLIAAITVFTAFQGTSGMPLRKAAAVSMDAAFCETQNKTADPDAAVYNEIYNKLIAMKSKYPEGTRWTNDNGYSWNGGIYTTGYGCYAYAFTLSDAVFGKLPARTHTDFSAVRPGDILRLNNDTHSVVILKKEGNIVTVTEGNYNSSVHWGRTIDLSKQSGLTYVMTRYPKIGDASLDNMVNSGDASLALMEYAAVSTNSPSVLTDPLKKWAADADRNGTINSSDASLILAYYAYLSTSGGIKEPGLTEWAKTRK